MPYREYKNLMNVLALLGRNEALTVLINPLAKGGWVITWLIKTNAFRGAEAVLILRQTTNMRNIVSGPNDIRT